MRTCETPMCDKLAERWGRFCVECDQPPPYALDERTVAACIENAKREARANNYPQSDGCWNVISALTDMLPDPRRKKMEEAMLAELRKNGLSITNARVFDACVDAAMGVE